MGRKKGQACYYCGEPSVSEEHAPPKQMFKGFDCDSITVPSCENHNSRKGGNDQAIISALLLPLSNSADRCPQEVEIEKAIEHARPSFIRAKRSALNVPLLQDPPAALVGLPNVSYIAPSANIRFWVKQLTAALIYDAAERIDSIVNWDEVAVWSPDLIPDDSASPLPADRVLPILLENRRRATELEALSWSAGWSAHPRPYPTAIYQFQIHFKSVQVIFRHSFYGRYAWYVLIPALDGTTLKVLHARVAPMAFLSTTQKA